MSPRLPHITLAALAIAAIAAGFDASAQVPAGAPRTEAYNAKQAVESEAAIRKYLAAVNAGDKAAIDALVGPRMVMTANWGECRGRGEGAACFRRFTDSEIADGAKLDIQALKVERDVVRVNIALHSPAIDRRAPGGVLVTDEFTVADNQIASFIRTPRTEDAATHAYYAGRRD